MICFVPGNGNFSSSVRFCSDSLLALLTRETQRTGRPHANQFGRNNTEFESSLIDLEKSLSLVSFSPENCALEDETISTPTGSHKTEVSRDE
jgi:hypothetical protein